MRGCLSILRDGIFMKVPRLYSKGDSVLLKLFLILVSEIDSSVLDKVYDRPYFGEGD